MGQNDETLIYLGAPSGYLVDRPEPEEPAPELPYRMQTHDAAYWRNWDLATGVIALRRAYWAVKSGRFVGFSAPTVPLTERITKAPKLRELAQRIAMALGNHREMVINSLMLQVVVEDVRWKRISPGEPIEA